MESQLIKKIKCLPDEERKFIPVELMLKGMSTWEQYAATVLDYTSRYNMTISISYAPENLLGKYAKYPLYGDSTETYILRTYGKWWKESGAAQQEYMPQEADPLEAEDYITLGFKEAVVPRDVCIYETYNPGAVVRIWGRYNGLNWKLLWQGPPQICPEEARKFHPKIKLVNCLINELRLEFNQSHLRYHTSIDAVLLGGYRPRNFLPHQILQHDLLNWGRYEEKPLLEEKSSRQLDYFSGLPHEVILLIFQYLDLTSLSRCTQVNRTWYEATLDPILYQNLSLKRYWHKLSRQALEFFKKRCRGLRKLDVSWGCSEEKDFPNIFVEFLQQCCKQLTHLSLCHCNFVTRDVVGAASSCQDITELRLRNAKTDSFQQLASLHKLITLDLSNTSVTDEHLVMILRANTSLQHLLLDFCEHLERLDQVVKTVTNFNKNLVTWSSYKATSLTPLGCVLFGRCANIKELDLGWCLLGHPGDSLEKIAHGCRFLTRLIVSKWPGINDQMLLPVVEYCKGLTQLDLLGIRTITNDICERALVGLPELRLLDISFCNLVTNDQVAIWRIQFPQVTIQRSCQYEITDYLN